MRTCREMGIPVVAVYADPDARAPHTVFADERVALNGPTPRQAYLDIEQLVRVAREHGADLRTGGPQGKRRSDTAPVADATGGDDRTRTRRPPR